jgi:predicted nuclease with TOPRIM domain
VWTEYRRQTKEREEHAQARLNHLEKEAASWRKSYLELRDQADTLRDRVSQVLTQNIRLSEMLNRLDAPSDLKDKTEEMTSIDADAFAKSVADGV